MQSQEDRDFVISLNQKEVDVLSPMDFEKLALFEKIADVFWIIKIDENPAAFLIAIRENASYLNENYAFFQEKYARFLYIDRIVIDEPYRKIGLGKAIYKALKEFALNNGVSTITAEVDIEPVYNNASLRFHANQGFYEVGTQWVRGKSVKVSLLVWNAGENQ